VSRAAARLICLGLVGAVAMPIGSAAHAGTPAAEGCTWQRHAKRVVKQMKRDGRVRRVKRAKHWWTCDQRPAAPALPAPPLALPPAPPPANALPPDEPQPEGTVSHLGVKAVEWSYTLSRPEVSAGKVIVELNNQGEDNHNLKLQREGSGDPPLVVPEAAPGEHTTASFDLPVGSYRLYCSLFEHDEKGMHATLLVGTPEPG
jgi:plastocyanin